MSAHSTTVTSRAFPAYSSSWSISSGLQLGREVYSDSLEILRPALPSWSCRFAAHSSVQFHHIDLLTLKTLDWNRSSGLDGLPRKAGGLTYESQCVGSFYSERAYLLRQNI